MRYSSASVDGRASNTNNQPSWLGEGWEFGDSYIDRSYLTCKDDGQAGKYDLCWRNWNASLVLNGKATELVRDDTTKTWRLKDDDGSKVELLTGAVNNDEGTVGVDVGEHWRITTTDGTQYWFGLNVIPGSPANTYTNSVMKVPVFGDDTGEPCNTGATFSANGCSQAWKWGLDYVTDTNGNSMSYWYGFEVNRYLRTGTTDPAKIAYQRGGWLKEIRYGLREGGQFAGGAPANAGYKVVFDTAERCIQSDMTKCATANLTSTTQALWPDVPFDSICTGACTAAQSAPTFFTRRRLTGVTTKAWNATLATPAWQDVSNWKVTQSFLDPGDTGDSTDASLWLSAIQRTGLAGTATPLPPVTFAHMFLPNRVDGFGDDILPLNKPRINYILDELGATTDIAYMPADCTTTNKPTEASLDSQTRRCFPRYWYPLGTKKLDLFHRYPVASVTVNANQGGPPVVSTYTYEGGMAWHYDNAAVMPDELRTWSQSRGFGKVTTRVGTVGSANRSKTTAIYLRGMDGDKRTPTAADPAKTKTVLVSGIRGETAAWKDSDPFAGFTREQATYLGDTTTLVGGEVASPDAVISATQKTPTALADVPSITAARVRTKASMTWDAISGSADRKRTVTTTYNASGMPVTVDDTGDPAAGDESCATNTYAPSPAGRLIADRIIRTQVLAVACAGASTAILPADTSTAGDVVSDTLTRFDANTTWTASQALTKGNPTWTGRTKGYTGTTPLVGTGTSTTFDDLGRALIVTNALGKETKTTYVPALALPQTSSTITPPLLNSGVTTALDPRLGLPLTVTDVNGKVTTQQYDALGRQTKVWVAGSPTSGTPDVAFAYSVTNAASTISSVATTTPTTTNGTITSWAFIDGLGRTIQTESPTPVGGRLITANLFDDQGRASATWNDLWDSTAPNGTRFIAADGGSRREYRTAYDGAGRVQSWSLIAGGVLKQSTTTTYTGDSVATTAVQGGTAVRVYSDARGRQIRRLTYPSTTPTGPTDQVTTNTYDKTGRLKSLTGPDGAAWTYIYDLYGRQISVNDPDTGNRNLTYDDLDRVTSSTDARAVTIYTTYDDLGRVKTTGTTAAGSAGSLLTQRTYDGPNGTATTGFKGQLYSATSYIGSTPGVPGTPYTRTITGYDDEYHATGSTLTLPSGDPFVAAGVGSTLTFTSSYTEGQVTSTTEPSVPGLQAETLALQYQSTGQLARTSSNWKLADGTTDTIYLYTGRYAATGEPTSSTMATQSTAPSYAVTTYGYQDYTRRLVTATMKVAPATTLASNYTYAYDEAGNLTSLKDQPTTAGAAADLQCFGYDTLARLQDAWTPGDGNCATAAGSAALGGAAPYRHNYTHTIDGSRAKLTDTTGAAMVTTYGYDNTQAPRHALRTVTVGTGTPQAYTYHVDGSTKSRPAPGGSQTFTWDANARLSRITQTGTKPSATDYIYEADGTLLQRRTNAADGESVLYLGATEVHLPRVGGVTKPATSTRTYPTGSSARILRTSAGISYLFSDHHGTGTTTATATGTITKRYQAPYGTPRGSSVAWVDDKGFLGKPADPTTGLTDLGAREYDPTLGRFLSVDPVLDPANPHSLNGYAYAQNNPTSYLDPTGLILTSGTGAATSDDYRRRNNGGKNRIPNPRIGGGANGSTPPPPANPGAGAPKQGPLFGPGTYPTASDCPSCSWVPPKIIEGVELSLGHKIVLGGIVVGAAVVSCWLWCTVTAIAAAGEVVGVTLIEMAAPGATTGMAVGAVGASSAFYLQQAGGRQVASGVAAKSVNTAKPWELVRTEALSGRASVRKVGEIADSMRVNGWQGDPIKVVELNGQRIVVDGHHRLAAARQAGIDVQYEVVDPATVIGPNQWSSVDDILRDAATVGPNRIR